jgi:hypothetical protein
MKIFILTAAVVVVGFFFVSQAHRDGFDCMGYRSVFIQLELELLK